MIEMVTRPHRENFLRWAEGRPRVVVLSADLTASCEADLFRDTLPNRFFSLGMAEQNLVSFAAGMAREGYYPWLHTFAVFLTRRPFDQVAMSVAYPNLPVRFVGFLPGITTSGGVTHQAIDDVALMRVLPNMTIFEVGDATEVETVLDPAQDVDGPVYIRMLRGEVPRLFTKPFQPGAARVLSNGHELAILTSGICTRVALPVCRALEKRGVSVRHLHVSTLKPFDDDQIREAIAAASSGVITLENHSIIGGVGSAVAETIAEMGAGTRLVRLGLQDVFAHGASLPYLMKEYSMDAGALLHAAETLLGQPIETSEDELDGFEFEGPADRIEDL